MSETEPQNDIAKEKSAELIYSERRDLFLKDLMEKMDQEDVGIAIVAIIDPKIPDQPIVYGRGQTYPLAKLSCDIAKYLKSKLDGELSLG